MITKLLPFFENMNIKVVCSSKILKIQFPDIPTKITMIMILKVISETQKTILPTLVLVL